MSETNWKDMDHKLPDGWEKYLMMLCEAGGAPNELTLLSRYQKVLRRIHDDTIADHRPPPDHYEALAVAREVQLGFAKDTIVRLRESLKSVGLQCSKIGMYGPLKIRPGECTCRRCLAVKLLDETAKWEEK